MAWRPHEHLIDGYLDNTEPGKVTGHLRFVGMPEMVRLNLEGDFHREYRGENPLRDLAAPFQASRQSEGARLLFPAPCCLDSRLSNARVVSMPYVFLFKWTA